MGDLAFFSSDEVADLVTGSLQLALLFKCDPYVFLERPGSEVNELYRLVSDELHELHRDKE